MDLVALAKLPIRAVFFVLRRIKWRLEAAKERRDDQAREMERQQRLKSRQLEFIQTADGLASFWGGVAASQSAGGPAADLESFYRRFSELADAHSPESFKAPDMFSDDDGSLDAAVAHGVYLPEKEADIDSSTNGVAWQRFFGEPGSGVFLILGQSNAGNHSDTPTKAKGEVYNLNFLNMTCHRAEDPLGGATGNGGSVWPGLGDRLIDAGLFDSVLFVPIAVGGCFVENWLHEGSYSPRLKLAVERIRRGLGSNVLPFTGVILQLGEAEANQTEMSADEFRNRLNLIVAKLREEGIVCPVFVSQTTLCTGPENGVENAAAIRKGQSDAVSPAWGILAGPDTDAIGPSLRHDECHFTGEGAKRCAEVWLDALSSVYPAQR